MFRFSGPKKIISAYVRNFESPLPLVRHRMHLAWPFPSHFLRKHYEDDPIPETRAFFHSLISGYNQVKMKMIQISQKA